MFERLFNITKDNQKIKDNLTKTFATKQLKDLRAFDSFIFDNKHCVFRFIFALIFFKFFLFRNNRIIIIVNKTLSSTILIKKSFLL